MKNRVILCILSILLFSRTSSAQSPILDAIKCAGAYKEGNNDSIIKILRQYSISGKLVVDSGTIEAEIDTNPILKALEDSLDKAKINAKTKAEAILEKFHNNYAALVSKNNTENGKRANNISSDSFRSQLGLDELPKVGKAVAKQLRDMAATKLSDNEATIFTQEMDINFPPVTSIASTTTGSGFISALNSTPAGTVAAGTAQFLVTRVEDDVVLGFVSDVSIFLQNRKLNLIFPQTADVLRRVDSYKIPTFIQSVRESAEKDLSNITQGLSNYVDSVGYFDSLSSVEIKPAILTVLSLIQGIQQRESPRKIIILMSSRDSERIGKSVLCNSLGTIKLLSESFGDSTGEDWADPSVVKNLFSDSIATKYFMGILIQESRMRKFQPNFDIAKHLPDILSDVNSLQLFIAEFNQFYLSANNSRNEFNRLVKSSTKLNPATIQEYASFVEEIIGTVKTGLYFTLDVAGKITNANSVESQYLKHVNGSIVLDTMAIRMFMDSTVIPAIQQGENIYEAVMSKEYARVISSMFTLSEEILYRVKDNALLERAISDSIIDVKSKPPNETKQKDDIATLQSTRSTMIRDSAKFGNTFSSDMLTYCEFVASLVEANSSDDVQSVLETFALPPGSAKIKRRSSFNISLNAYIGAELFSPPPFKSEFNNGSLRILAPIGIAFSFDKPSSDCLGIHGFSLFGTIIDVGNVVMPVITANQNQIDDITLATIFTPGLGGMINFTSPFGLGARYFYTADVITNRLVPNWSIFFTYDIPIFNFYTMM